MLSFKFILPATFFFAALHVCSAQSANYTGNLFWFVPGLGACGFDNTTNQYVASVSSYIFNNFTGATTNPNDNPICQHNVTITYNDTTVTAGIVDYCESCTEYMVGLSPVAFENFAYTSVGIVPNVNWTIV